MYLLAFSLLTGWILDLLLGDPARLPHPVVGFSRWIGWGERLLNRGRYRQAKGALLAVVSIAGVFALTTFLTVGIYRTSLHAVPLLSATLQTTQPPYWFPQLCYVLAGGILVFYGLAGTTLVREVREVFRSVSRSLPEGRRQVGRIVGRDTTRLSAQEVRTAALETLAENLSDGVIAPLFWLLLLGLPGMMAYKMVNTLDSMIGYRNERFLDFGRWAARIDDAANYIPARLTAWLLVLAATLPHAGTPTRRPLKQLFAFIGIFGPRHASPNSGWPEAALAGILDCRFGGSHHYFGQVVYKPYIGSNDRLLTDADLQASISVFRYAETLFVLVCYLLFLWS